MNRIAHTLRTRLSLAALALAMLGTAAGCDEGETADDRDEIYDDEGTGGEADEYWDADAEAFPYAGDATDLHDPHAEGPADPIRPGDQHTLADATEARTDAHGHGGTDLSAGEDGVPCDPNSPHFDLAEALQAAKDAEAADPTELHEDTHDQNIPGPVPGDETTLLDEPALRGEQAQDPTGLHHDRDGNRPLPNDPTLLHG